MQEIVGGKGRRRAKMSKKDPQAQSGCQAPDVEDGGMCVWETKADLVFPPDRLANVDKKKGCPHWDRDRKTFKKRRMRC